MDKLFIEARKVVENDSADLPALITVSHFDNVLARKLLCNHKVLESNDHLSLFQRPSLALKLGHSLKECAGILNPISHGVFFRYFGLGRGVFRPPPPLFL